MKNSNTLIYACGIVLLACMASCGGTKKSNAFGEIPSMVSELKQKREDIKNLAYSDKDKKEKEKIATEYFAYEKELKDMFEEKGMLIVGNDVPFSGDPFTDISIKEVKIDKYKTMFNKPFVTLRIYASPKVDLVMDDNNYLAHTMAVFVDTKGNELFALPVYPFTSTMPRVTLQYGIGDVISSTQLCNDQGTPVELNLIDDVDLSDFARVEFLSDEEYNSRS